MRILNVNMSIDPICGGGTAERTVQISRFLAGIGQNCTVLTLDIGVTGERLNTLASVNLIALPCLYERFYLPRCTLSTISGIVAQSDIIHLMSHWTVLNALVYYCARQQNKPYVVCPAGSLPIFGRSGLVKRIYNSIVGQDLIRNADRCIAITPSESACFESLGVGKDSISIIPNGVCMEDYVVKDDLAFRRAYRLTDAPFILFIGRLNSIKGPDILLRSFCAIKDKCPHHLVLAGPDGGMLNELEGIVSQANVKSRVHFVGYLDATQKSLAYHAAELLVIPSRSEAMSLVVLESGASGTPVLITDRCGFDDVGKLGGGAMVPASEEGIREGLLGLLSRSGQLKQMGDKLRRYTQESFAWEIIISKYMQVYEEILRVRNTCG